MRTRASFSRIFYGDGNEHFRLSCDMLNLNKNNCVFIDFVCSGKGEQILNSNSLASHIETPNIFLIISIPTKIFTIFYSLNKTQPKKLSKKDIGHSKPCKM